MKQLSNKQVFSHLKSCAELDVELCEKEYLRSYRFYPEWSEGVQVATYENGGGDDLVVVFCGDSILIKGFDHESEVSPHAQDEYGIWPGIYEGAPLRLLEVLDDKVFEKKDVTFCLWREADDVEWKRGPVSFPNDENDGSDWLLSAIRTSPEDFIAWGKDYFEDDFSRVSESRIHEIFASNQ
ncbi:hypothetical protein MO867_16090 [Microbulbifer sp. OS29]|uniref:Uncharacterized protein n=1 Tax=Microbulbifer okhotskensis TaxID=2926617 RepID=A0A9X2EU50_9GAMM|nr:hypothetical protein [Microbulbifer okhotskensis]MCO1335856.1 hypothetical protein [Microbulbifer okhotskensis]